MSRHGGAQLEEASDESPDEQATRVVNAFVEEVRGPGRSRAMPRVAGAAAAVVLVGAAAVGVGMLTKPSAEKPQAATTPHGEPGSATARASASGTRASAGVDPGRSTAPGTPVAGASTQPAAGASSAQPSAGVSPHAKTNVPGAGSSAPPQFTAITGYDCASDSAASFSDTGWYTSGNAGWVVGTRGGWGTEGCKGEFAAMPMSGSATGDSSDYAEWIFHTGSLVSGSCTVYVFTPNSTDPAMVGGDPAHYDVFNSESAVSGPAVGIMNIDQLSTVNTWVDGGTFTLADSTLMIKLDNRGADSSGQHLAVSQVRVDCDG